MTLVLRQLAESDEAAFFEGLSHWSEDERDWYTFHWKPGVSYSEMLALLDKQHRGIDLPSGRVPATMYYGFVDGRIVGRLHLRHQLNDELRQRGGHFGYAVAAPYRGKGYATEMARQALVICARLGIERALVTCAEDNTASWKLIENLGGVLESRGWDEEEEETIRRYWIEVQR